MRGVEERDGWLKLSEEEMSKDSNYARMQVKGGERDQRYPVYLHLQCVHMC